MIPNIIGKQQSSTMIPENSLTKIGDIEGNQEPTNYINGAEYVPDKPHTKFYERAIYDTIEMPWLAQSQEVTYLNRTKPENDIGFKIRAIPKINNETVESHESFDGETTYSTTLIRLTCIVFIIFLIYYLAKQFIKK